MTGRTLPRYSVLVAVVATLPYLLLPAKPLLHDAWLAILENPVVTSGKLVETFSTDFWGNPLDSPTASGSYRPLVSLGYALQYRTWGDAASWFHLTDIALHALAAVLVLRLMTALGLGKGPALGGALLFALHPVQSEAVCSAVGRADVLAAICLISALVLHLEAPRTRRPWLGEAGTLALLGAGLLCKEYAVSFPFILVAVDLALGRRRQRCVLVWTGGFALLAGYLLLRYALIGSVGGVPMIGEVDNALYGKPLIARWSTAAWLLAVAARLLVAPYGLNHHYVVGSLPIAETPFSPRAIAGIVLLASLTLGALWLRRRRGTGAPLVALVLFCFPLAPALNTVSVGGVIFAERWLYLPAAGLAVLSAWLLARLPPRFAATAASVLLVLCAAATAFRVQDWGSAESLARSSLRAYPGGAKVWRELGDDLRRQGRNEESVAALERSLALTPDGITWWSYASSLSNLGRHAEAADALREVIAAAPREGGTLWKRLGIEELRAGHARAAGEALARACELLPEDPGCPEALFDAALLAVRGGEQGVAAPWFDAALERDPQILRRRHERARSFEQSGDYRQAADTLREILAARPDHVPTLFNLGSVLLLAGEPEQAIGPLRHGLALRDDPRARALLARAEAEKEKAR